MRLIAANADGALRFDLTGVTSAVRTRCVDGTDELRVTWCGRALDKDDRVIVMLAPADVREYMVVSATQSRASGRMVETALLRNSVAELSRKYHLDLRCRGYSAKQALEKCLAGTRWSPGAVRLPDSQTADVAFYHQTADKSLSDICDAYACELDAKVTVSGNRVTARSVSLYQAIGSTSPKRFEYRRDLVGVKRTVSADDVVTRVYAWGKGLPKEDGEGDETGGYTRKVGIASVNDGKDYVEDADATSRFGVPGADGTRQPAEGYYENGDIEEPAQLLELAKADLARRSKPIVSYEFDIAPQDAAARIGCGDVVRVVDEAFDPPLRIEARVLKVELDLTKAAGAVKVSIGNVRNPLTRISGIRW